MKTPHLKSLHRGHWWDSTPQKTREHGSISPMGRGALKRRECFAPIHLPRAPTPETHFYYVKCSFKIHLDYFFEILAPPPKFGPKAQFKNLIRSNMGKLNHQLWNMETNFFSPAAGYSCFCTYLYLSDHQTYNELP